jgi:enediyne biosynthesis protein E4
MSESESASEGAILEGDTFSAGNIANAIKSGTKYLQLVIVAFIVSIVVSVLLWNRIKDKPVELYHKIILILMPQLITYLLLKLYYTPKPRYHYMLSVLYDDDPIKLGMEHKNTGTHWPFYGSASVRLNDKEHIFLGGGEGQDDQLLVYEGNKFKNIIHGKGLSSKAKTYSAVAIDMNYDGKDDLIIGRSDGVWLYLQQENGSFKSKKIMEPQDKVPLAISVSDYNKDERPDVYLSYFTKVNKYKGSVFNNSSHNRKNALLKNTSKNNNDIQFKDVTAITKSGGKYNTFTSIFVDLNNDTWPDLVLSNDSGEMEVLENVKGEEFKERNAYDYKGNWMGIGASDIDNDGDIDLFLTNVGTGAKGDAFAYGDIKKGQKQTLKHILLRNDGEFKFSEISDKMGISHDGFGWGAVMTDLNLDGNVDLLFSDGFSMNPLHRLYPRVGYQYDSKNGKYVRKFTYKNNATSSQTPLITDFNKDGIKDVIWINMGSPSLAYKGNFKNNNNFINIILPNTAKFANAKIIVDMGKNGKKYRENIQGGSGFGSDNMSAHYIGLGKYNKINKVTVSTIYGKEYNIKNPKANSMLKLVDINIK